VEKDFLQDFYRKVLSQSARGYFSLSFNWIFGLIVLSEALIFLSGRLFSSGLAWFFYLIPIFWLSLIPYFLMRRSDAVHTFFLADKNLKLEERLVTAYEVLQRDGPSTALEKLLLDDVCRRLEDVKPEEALPRITSRKHLVPIIVAIAVFSIAPFVSQLNFGPSQERLFSETAALLRDLSALPGSEKEAVYLEVLQAKKHLEEGNFREAGINLEDARKLLEELMKKDSEALKKLEASEELSFITWGLKNKSTSSLEQLSRLTPEEKMTQAAKIAEKMKDLPEGPINSALKEMVDSLNQNSNKLGEISSKLVGIPGKEDSAYLKLSSLLSGIKPLEKKLQAQLSEGTGQIPGEVEQGQGMGTQGGLAPSEKEEDISAYTKSQAGRESQLPEGLIYLPPQPLNGKGEPLVFPREAEGKFKVFAPGNSDTGSFYSFSEVLPDYEAKAAEQFLRLALPPHFEDLVHRYYQYLEESP